MSIETTYRELILEEVIRDILTDGLTPTVSRITSNFNTFVADNDLSEPLFKYDDHKVDYLSHASASKTTLTNNSIYRDTKVLYRHMLGISEQTIINFDRWRAEAWLLEGKLNSLVDRINQLLVTSQDTAGYLNFVQDNFTDTSKTDLTNTTAYVNTAKQYVTIGTSAVGPTRIDLSSLLDTAVEFTVLTRNTLVSVQPQSGSKRVYAFSDINNYWQERIYMSKPVVVTAELKVDLGSSQPVSRIDVDLHMSNTSQSVQVTPMYSTDNFNWKNLPIDNFTASVLDYHTFQLTATTMRYVKFIFTKQGPDITHKNMYVYELGVDEISFFNEGFTADTETTFISKPLSVIDTKTSLPQKFNKVVLDVCEQVPTDTSIDYYVTASNDSTVPVTASGIWVAIDPITRTAPTQPTSLDFGNLAQITVSGITLSYDKAATDTKFTNPARQYTYITGTSGSSVVSATVNASSQRYSFLNSNERILNYELASSIEIAEGTLEVWRNVKLPSSEEKIREVNNGWGFTNPWYYCAVSVSNPNGVQIDFGPQAVGIDGELKTGLVSLAYGRHLINVHKDNWVYFSPSGITTLAQLKAADSLYPYNHRYLVESFPYPGSWSTDEEKVYLGFDIVAEFFMKEVSPFDLIHNVKSTDYDKFALDLDAADTSASGVASKPAAKVFLIKADETKSDFTNERFLVKFKAVDTLFQYLRLKAVFKTSDTNIAPFLDAYRIKLAS